MEEVHKIAILDLRILNCDRNEANILVQNKVILSKNTKKSEKYKRLIPIDHGLSFPDNFEICEDNLSWMTYSQVRQPMSEKSLKFIEEINPLMDCQMLRDRLGFREICLRNFRIA